MRNLQTLWMAAAVTPLLLCSCSSIAEPATMQEPIRLPAWEAVWNYYLQDCGTGESDPRRSLQLVVELADQTTVMLLSTVREGIPAEELARLTEDAEADSQRLSDYVQRGGLDSLQNEDVLEEAKRRDPEEAAARRVRSFAFGAQESALNALVAIGTPAVKTALQGIATGRDLDPRLAQLVQEAIARIE